MDCLKNAKEVRKEAVKNRKFDKELLYREANARAEKYERIICEKIEYAKNAGETSIRLWYDDAGFLSLVKYYWPFEYFTGPEKLVELCKKLRAKGYKISICRLVLWSFEISW